MTTRQLDNSMQSSQRASVAPPVSEERWTSYRDVIEHYYVDMKMTLNRLQTVMKSKYDFGPTKDQYKPTLSRWGVYKNKRNESSCRSRGAGCSARTGHREQPSPYSRPSFVADRNAITIHSSSSSNHSSRALWPASDCGQTNETLVIAGQQQHPSSYMLSSDSAWTEVRGGRIGNIPRYTPTVYDQPALSWSTNARSLPSNFLQNLDELQWKELRLSYDDILTLKSHAAFVSRLGLHRDAFLIGRLVMLHTAVGTEKDPVSSDLVDSAMIVVRNASNPAAHNYVERFLNRSMLDKRVVPPESTSKMCLIYSNIGNIKALLNDRSAIEYSDIALQQQWELAQSPCFHHCQYLTVIASRKFLTEAISLPIAAGETRDLDLGIPFDGAGLWNAYLQSRRILTLDSVHQIVAGLVNWALSALCGGGLSIFLRDYDGQPWTLLNEDWASRTEPDKITLANEHSRFEARVVQCYLYHVSQQSTVHLSYLEDLDTYCGVEPLETLLTIAALAVLTGPGGKSLEETTANQRDTLAVRAWMQLSAVQQQQHGSDFYIGGWPEDFNGLTARFLNQYALMQTNQLHFPPVGKYSTATEKFLRTFVQNHTNLDFSDAAIRDFHSHQRPMQPSLPPAEQ